MRAGRPRSIQVQMSHRVFIVSAESLVHSFELDVRPSLSVNPEAAGSEQAATASPKSKWDFFVTSAIAAAGISFVLYRMATTVADPDLWGYLAFGRLFWQSSQFPYHDIFSFVPTLPTWVYHEWLTGVVFFPIYNVTGPAGLQVVKFALGLACLALIYLTARRRGATPGTAFLGVLLINGLLRLGYSPVRAQMFTYFFFALSLYLLESARLSGRKTRLWALVPIHLVWANLHAGFLAGLGLIAIYAVCQLLRRRPCRIYWHVLMISGLVTIINPYGLQYWRYLVATIPNAPAEISEWGSVIQTYHSSSQTMRFTLVYYFLLAAFAVIWWLRRRELTGGVSLAVTMVLGILHQRHQVFFCILSGVYLPDLLTIYIKNLKLKVGERFPFRRPDRGVLVAAGILITVMNIYLMNEQAPMSLKIPSSPEQSSETGVFYPVDAVTFIQQHHLSGDLLVHFDWGEYVIWNLYPQCRVAIDGRFETVYPLNLTRAYFDFIYGRPGWAGFLDKYRPDFILIDSRSEVCSKLLGNAGWEQVYRDAGSALFRRR